MVKIPVLRWGQPYESLETARVVHFNTGETIAEVSQANAGLLVKDMRKAQRARDALREIPIRDLIGMMKKAGELFKDVRSSWETDSRRPTILRGSNRLPRGSRNTCARRTWRRTSSFSRTWTGFWIA